MKWRRTLNAGLLVCGLWHLAGCGAPGPEPTAAKPEPVALAPRFDAATAGTLRGHVLWSGAVPDVPPFEIRSLVSEWNPPKPRLVRENPYVPRVERDTGRVGDAVIFLCGVDPQLSRPWDHPPVVVEHRERQLGVQQGDIRSRVGFVRRGAAVTMVSRESAFNALHASGAAFFTLTFPDPDQPLRRQLKAKGRVELSSGAGAYWMRGHLFVDDHPYYARTDSHGCFELRQVPPGRYRIVCWMPNWNRLRQDRDPESGLVTRLEFQPPLELEQPVIIEAAGESQVNFTIQASLFQR